MARLGVVPNTVMGRTVWLKDVEQFVLDNRLGSDVSTLHSGACSSTFSSLVSSLDASVSPVGYALNVSIAAPTRNMLARVSQQRQNLGKHRHDLLVALRLVNRVERDFLEAEWEEWVWREGSRCQRAKKLLDQRQDASSQGSDHGEWWNGYCASCVEAMNGLESSSASI